MSNYYHYVTKILLGFSVVLFLFWSPAVNAAEHYPKLANYYLSWFGPEAYSALAKFDLLILQPEMLWRNRSFFKSYPRQHPGGKLIAYLYPSSFYREALFYDDYGIRQNIFFEIAKQDWWLRDSSGQVVSSWPLMGVVNLTNPDWRAFNIKYLIDKYQIKQHWQGVFWDLVDSQPSKYSANQIDIDADGLGDSTAEVDAGWQQAMTDFLQQSRSALDKRLMIINGSSWPAWQANINGRMFEHFPTPWEGDWSANMTSYLKDLPGQNFAPETRIINVRYDPSLQADIYQQLRFGLASALMGDAYFSFDAGAQSHGEIWWFDEYDQDLGRPVSVAQRLEPTSFSPRRVLPGLWSRQFEQGLVLVNSGSNTICHEFKAGLYRRIKGQQDPKTNNGLTVTKLCLNSQDGIVLLK